MRKKTVTTAQLESLTSLFDLIRDQAVYVLPEQAEHWDRSCAQLRGIVRDTWRQSARPHAGRDMARLAELLASTLLAVLEGKAPPERSRQLPPRQPRMTTVVVENREITVESPAQQEMIRLMGEEGLSRSWRIYARIIDAGLLKNRRSASNALQKLRQDGLVTQYRDQKSGDTVRWAYAPGGGRILPLLTAPGQAWFRGAYGLEPVQAEIFEAVRRHQSPEHGVAILEAYDHLRDAGYSVDATPEAILARAGDEWGRRVEPDLVVHVDGTLWPVEVQREVSKRTLTKYNKAIALGRGRLMLIVFNEQGCRKQEGILREAILRKRVRRGTILLTSLEAMETQVNWEWKTIKASGHW